MSILVSYSASVAKGGTYFPDALLTLVECTQEGKFIARQNPDFVEGRPKKYSKEQMDHALYLLESNSYKQVEQMTGISKSTLIRGKRERNIKLTS